VPDLTRETQARQAQTDNLKVTRRIYLQIKKTQIIQQINWKNLPLPMIHVLVNSIQYSELAFFAINKTKQLLFSEKRCLWVSQQLKSVVN